MTSATLMREAAGSLLAGTGSIVGTDLVHNGATGTPTTTYTTASITVAAGDLVMLHVGAASASTVGSMTPSGASQTWLRPSALGAWFPDVTPDDARRTAVWYCIGTPGSGAITFTLGNACGGCCWDIAKFTGVDLTNPFVYGTMLGTAPNATSQTIYARKFLDAVYNASVVPFLVGDNTDHSVAGTGYTKLGSSSCGGALPVVGIEYKVGEDTTADWSWTGGSFSNLGFAYELRASGTAADPPIRCLSIGKGGQTGSATTHSLTTAFGTAPVYAGSDVIYLAFQGQRTGALPAASTVAGGGVTWVDLSSGGQSFNNDGTRDINRLMVFRAQGPLNGTDVVVTHPAAQSNFNAWMVAFPGADVTGTNGSGSVVQAVKSSAQTSASPTVTLAANSDTRNGVVAFHGTSNATSPTLRVIPLSGFVTCSHTEQSAGALPDPVSGGRLFAQFMPYNATTSSCTFPASGNVASIAVEVKTA